MQFVILGFLIIFPLVGLMLIRMGVNELMTMRRVRPRLLTAEGVVTRIHSERHSPASDADSKYYTISHFPQIQFHTATGESISFRSEVGTVEKRRKHGWTGPFAQKRTIDSQKQGYYSGQAVLVLYDPQGEITPRIQSWSALWGAAVAPMMGGVAFVGGAVMVWFFFGERMITGLRQMIG